MVFKQINLDPSFLPSAGFSFLHLIHVSINLTLPQQLQWYTEKWCIERYRDMDPSQYDQVCRNKKIQGLSGRAPSSWWCRSPWVCCLSTDVSCHFYDAKRSLLLNWWIWAVSDRFPMTSDFFKHFHWWQKHLTSFTLNNSINVPTPENVHARCLVYLWLACINISSERWCDSWRLSVGEIEKSIFMNVDNGPRKSYR